MHAILVRGAHGLTPETLAKPTTSYKFDSRRCYHVIASLSAQTTTPTPWQAPRLSSTSMMLCTTSLHRVHLRGRQCRLCNTSYSEVVHMQGHHVGGVEWNRIGLSSLYIGAGVSCGRFAKKSDMVGNWPAGEDGVATKDICTRVHAETTKASHQCSTLTSMWHATYGEAGHTTKPRLGGGGWLVGLSFK